MPPGDAANLRGRDLIRLPSEAHDQSFSEGQVAVEHGQPAAGWRRHADAPFQPCQQPLLREQQFFGGRNGQSVLESAHHLTPGECM